MIGIIISPHQRIRVGRGEAHLSFFMNYCTKWNHTFVVMAYSSQNGETHCSGK